MHYFLKLDLKFGEFKVGQTFKSYFLIDKDDFERYISFAKTRNILHDKPEVATKEGLKELFARSGYNSTCRGRDDASGYIF